MIEKAKENLREPFRVGVWGPGNVGMAALRELILLPETQPVSVLVYSDNKAGVDIGELAGKPHLGVKTTQDVDEFLSAKPECIIYTARDFGDHRADQDIVMLLEAGFNVITALPYHHLILRGAELVQRFESAAERGKATFFATGINPGFMFERMALLATGLSNDVQHISFYECVNCEYIPGAQEFLALCGFGVDTSSKEATEKVAAWVGSYITQGLYYVAEKLGVTVDRVEPAEELVGAPEDIDLPGIISIKQGHVARVGLKWTAICDGKPLLTTGVKWYVTEAMRPEMAESKGEDCWLIEVEGRPMVKLCLELYGSATEKHINPDNPTSNGWLSTAIPMIQAIPAVINAKPGILELEAPQFHFKKDLRLA